MKIGKSSFTFHNVYLKDTSVIAGPKEAKGPLKPYFDLSYDDLRCYEKSWEKAEIKMYHQAIEILLNKSLKRKEDIDIYISGDLNNQIIIGTYALRNQNANYLGIFNACASSVEGLIIASNIIEAQNANNIIITVSSHNATAERQFRYPTEYGGQKPPSLTCTVTAACSCLLTNEKTNIKITRGTIGQVIDYNQKDAQDMGRAMAPAAYQTLITHFNDFNISSNDYDLILTGDLSYYGKELLLQIMEEKGYNIKHNYNDCGIMIYDRDKQNVFSGGSGCGCLPSVCYSYVLDKMRKKELKKVLLVATGALHNPILLAQKESIPVIAHAICLEVVE